VKPLKYILCVVLLGTLVPWAVNGRVFRITGAADGRLNAAGLPWEHAYSTVMDVNGQRNSVQVYSARFSEPVAEQLRAQFESQGAKVDLRQGADGGAMGVARWDGGEARFLVLAPDTVPNQIVFLFYPESGKKSKSAFPVPEYPRGVVENSVFNKSTDTFCATMKTLDAPGQVQRYYAGVLAGSGWEPLLPLKASGGMALFHKKEKTCCVLANRRESGETFVTLLVRTGGL
jgi:hypothetical protein